VQSPSHTFDSPSPGHCKVSSPAHNDNAENVPPQLPRTISSSRSTVSSASKSTRAPRPSPSPPPPKPLPLPSQREISEALSEIGKAADGISQAYLTFEMHNHPGTRTCSYLAQHAQLQKVLLSNNIVEDTKDLGHLPRLTHLDLSHNKLEQVLDIHPATPLLRFADLKHNNISSMRDIGAFQCLTFLHLDHNKLTHITGIVSLRALRVLTLTHNQLEAVTGLEELHLHELDISDNCVRTLEPLESVCGLRVLRASRNQLPHLRGLEFQFMLSTLDVSENRIDSMEELKVLEHLRMLKELHIRGNRLEVMTNARLHMLHVLPTLTSLNGKGVTSNEKVYSANLHGEDFFVTRQIRSRHFPKGELDDGGNAVPPLCVMLPADDGAHDANLHGRCLQTDPSSLDAALACVPAGSMEPLGDHFRAQFPDELDLLRALFGFVVHNGAPKEDATQVSPVLRPPLESFEKTFFPTDGGPESGIWAERITKCFTAMLNAAHLEAHEVIGYWAPKEWMLPTAMPLIVPNTMWTAVFINKTWRLIDIAYAVQEQTLDTFYTPPGEFIKSHIPLAGRWQLLPVPIHMEEFWSVAIEAADTALKERTAAAQAAAEKLEIDTRNNACRSMVDRAVFLLLEEERLESALPLKIARDAVSKAIANNS